MDFKYCPTVYRIGSVGDESEKMLAVGVIQPIKMSVTHKVNPPSTASITIESHSATEDQVGLAVGEFLLIRTPVKSQLMYVKSISTDYINGNQRTVSCEGVFGLFADALLFGKVTPKTINQWAGKSGTTKSYAADAINYVITNATEQIRGGHDATADLFEWSPASPFAFADVRQGWSFNGVSALSALNDITACLRDYEWDIRFDEARGKIVIGMNKQATTVSCELRESRNIKTMKVTVDRKDYYSVIYPIGKNDKNIKSAGSLSELVHSGTITHSSGDAYLINEDAVAEWGYVAVQESDSTKSDADDLMTWGAELLAKHSQPIVNISVDALELSQITGSSFDNLSPGKRCQIPLPQYGLAEPFVDRIIDCTFSDLCSDEYSCKLTIANERKEVKDVLYKSGGGGGGKKAANENTSDHCDLHSEAQTAQNTANAIKNEALIKLAGKTNVKWKQVEIAGTVYTLLQP